MPISIYRRWMAARSDANIMFDFSLIPTAVSSSFNLS